eukprot:CAMPEP_0197702200 /NCGR_PEP_ID=MMETSP1338-20131121/124218_1 /TAXON_ID=43686 ORGANISM="Pelagodinium beii, Strain RCC1491" /NCGR_SAMPLE_ID=MMETSP1338 /ASSEMBLY_ACC=CAM_ASM_000754 /LENGTH=112 /DNA_ID=CAMNT_0043286001 /DNA_START=38 /DNA_END=373 /DNA_ORIENTATION=-
MQSGLFNLFKPLAPPRMDVKLNVCGSRRQAGITISSPRTSRATDLSGASSSSIEHASAPPISEQSAQTNIGPVFSPSNRSKPSSVVDGTLALRLATLTVGVAPWVAVERMSA